MGRGKEIRLGVLAETRGDRVLMNVVLSDAVVCGVADAMVGEASLPDREFGGEAVGEASLDKSDGSFEVSCGVRRRWIWSGMTTKAWSL